MNPALEPEDFVPWGITSLYRFEFWENETNGTKIFTQYQEKVICLLKCMQ